MAKDSISDDSKLSQAHVGPDLHRRNCDSQVSHAHQIVGGAGESKDPVHFTNPTMPNQKTHVLQTGAPGRNRFGLEYPKVVILVCEDQSGAF